MAWLAAPVSTEEEEEPLRLPRSFWWAFVPLAVLFFCCGFWPP